MRIPHRSSASYTRDVFLYETLQRLRRVLSGSGIGRIPGIAWLYGKLFGMAPPRGIVEIPILSRFRMLVDTASGGLHPELLRKGVYEEETTAMLQRTLRPGMVFADVGANIGYFSVIAASLVGESGKVISFEPDPENAEFLRKNVALNGYGRIVSIEQSCLADRQGTVTLFRDATNRGNHSMARANVLRERGSVEVPCTTLDAYASLHGTKRIDIMKVDTQGAEGAILTGASGVLRSNPDIQIIVEYWPYGLANTGADPLAPLRFLRTEGFHFHSIDTKEDLTTRTDEAIAAMATAKRNGQGFLNLWATRNGNS
jgi:FkbM family methyltransferase